MSAAQRRSAGPLPRLAPLGLLGLIACAPPAPPAGPGADGGATGAATLRGEAWADNWFAAYIEDRLVGQDSVPITTERSFNAETFTFSATPPFTLSLVLTDYRENDTGLEYIGKANQQMGDGGFILQLTDLATSRVILGTSAAARCKVIHQAPLNKTCARDPEPEKTCQSRIEPEPDGWRREGFDDSAWPAATEYTPAQVGTKEGYDQIRWDPSARLIWGADLQMDNTLLCRIRVQ